VESTIKILIVEDEMIIAANTSLQLSNLGYEVSGIVSRGEDALLHIKENLPDIVLLDIQLKGELDGIETAHQMQKDYNIPIIYLTSNVDDAHFERAKRTNPAAFISKPFKKLDLQHAIELTANRIIEDEIKGSKFKVRDNKFVLSDRIFVRHNDRIVKIIIADILYIEADRNYCRIHSKGKIFLLVATLKDVEKKLPKEYFIRVHRSYIINLSQIDEVAAKHLIISRKAIPLSKSLRSNLLTRLQTI
jgi:DNA-binding LytR/AlgR family response regulator